jgi:broad specificity phosphatase PhoE/DNA-binding XRE family transcriptional regulator
MNSKLLGEKIKIFRTNRNLSQAEVAHKLGIHRPSVSQIERGLRELSPEELLELAQLFNITVDELLNTNRMPSQLQGEVSNNASVMRITFIRHGEASDDIYNQYGGWADPELTPAGVTKAYGLGKELSKNHYDRVYVSPLRRAKKMGEIIANGLNVDIKVMQYLKEKNTYGLLSGMNKDIAKRKYPELVGAYENGKYVLASEVAADFEARVKQIFTYFKRNWAKSVIAVTHGGVFKEIILSMLDMKVSNLEDGAVLVTEFDGEKLSYITSDGVNFTR